MDACTAAARSRNDFTSPGVYAWVQSVDNSAAPFTGLEPASAQFDPRHKPDKFGLKNEIGPRVNPGVYAWARFIRAARAQAAPWWQ